MYGTYDSLTQYLDGLFCIYLCTACTWLFWALAFETTLYIDSRSKKFLKTHQINKINPKLSQSNQITALDTCLPILDHLKI